MRVNLTRFISRHPAAIVALTLLVTAAALVPASRLTFRTDLPSLLPDESTAAEAWREYLVRFGGIEKVFVLLSTADPDVKPAQLAEAAAEFAQRLEMHEEVSSARAGVEPEDETAFLNNVVARAPLLLPEETWSEEVEACLRPESIHERVREIRRALVSPSIALTREFAIHDPLGLSSSLMHFQPSDLGLPVDSMTLAFLSADGDHALIIAEPKGSELDSSAGRRLLSIIRQTTAEVEEESGFRLEARAIGGPLYAAHDESVIRGDLQRTMSGTSIACAALLIAAFGGVGIPIAGLAALAAALIWLAAGLTLSLGGVSAAVVGFAAVLIGLGVDAAIHGGSSLRRLLHEGNDHAHSLKLAFAETGPAVLAASTTTAAAFAVLLFSAIPPLRELGLVVATGLFAMVLATATLGAASAMLLTGARNRATLVWTAIGRFVDGFATLSEAHPRRVLAGAAILTLVAVFPARQLELRPDPSTLRPLDNPLIETERRLAEVFGIGGDTATVLVHAETVDEVLKRAEAVRMAVLANDPDITVISPDQRLVGPSTTERRLVKIKEMAFAEATKTLRLEMHAAGLNSAAFAPGLQTLEIFAEGRDPRGNQPIEDEQLRQDEDGEVWASISIRAPHGTWEEGPPEALRATLEEASPGALVASMPLVGQDLRLIAKRDLRRLSGLSLFLIATLVLASFRGRPQPALLSLIPVVLGMTWALGWWSAIGRPLDLVSLAVLPVMLGLGIDDGLYAVHGAITRHGLDLGLSVRRSGKAMVLTTLTTAIGFGSLSLSHLPGLQAAALLAPVAVAACLVATLTVLPAIGALARTSHRGSKRKVQDAVRFSDLAR
ncbi:MAG: MMPL family transporter [Thermoanaerobaculales bacterium]|nr:MMPL family transporter [Thermoanaerobaculales bacterium]